MRRVPAIQAGERFGRWTALGPTRASARGETAFLCRCDCGTERYVLERSLRYDGSKSCGCLRDERAREAVELKLDGRTFGDLKVVRQAESRGGRSQWVCECACGNICEVPGTLLATDRKTHCGCKKSSRRSAIRDIRGMRFSRLVALEPLPKRDRKGGVIWLCRCDCGSVVEIPYDWLMYSNIRSCGCRKREHDAEFPKFIDTVDGTSINAIASRKVPSNSSTGVRGVFRVRGRFGAKINFQKRQYNLGTYETLEEAAAARKAAEERLFDAVTAHYGLWRERAEEDPEWAAANPATYSVQKEPGSAVVDVICLPKL